MYVSGGSTTTPGYSNQVINNLIEANDGPGVMVNGASGSASAAVVIENNTIVSTLYDLLPLTYNNTGIATSTTTTLNSTTLTINGSVSGTILPGMFITGAGIPQGVRVLSQISGTAGGVGSYLVTASAANVTTGESMTFTLFDAIAVQGSSSYLQIENNILDVSSGGYALQVAQNSEQGFESDYNLFMLSNASQAAFWENQSFASQTNWYYEVGFDQHSQQTNADFVNLSADANGAIGWDASQVASTAVSVNTTSSTYSQSGSWTPESGSGAGNDGSSPITFTLNGPNAPTQGNATQSANGEASGTTASWTINGLTPGDYYEIDVNWQQPENITVSGTNDYVASNAAYTAYVGTTVVGAALVNQESTITPGDAAGDFADANGVYWHPTLLVQASGASLTVVLDNVANQSFVRADGVRIVQLTGAVNQNNDAHLQSGSPAIAAGDPAHRT